MIKICKICGKEFEGIRNKKYCSKECFRKGVIRRHTENNRRYRQWKRQEKARAIQALVENQINNQNEQEIREIKTFTDLKEFVINLIKRVLNDNIDHKKANAISSLIRTLTDIMENEELAKKLEKIEEALEGEESRGIFLMDTLGDPALKRFVSGELNGEQSTIQVVKKNG